MRSSIEMSGRVRRLLSIAALRAMRNREATSGSPRSSYLSSASLARNEHFGYQVLRLVFRAGPRQAVPTDRVATVLVEPTEGGGISSLGGLDKRSVDTALLRALLPSHR
jgi:hypothetical protein